MAFSHSRGDRSSACRRSTWSSPSQLVSVPLARDAATLFAPSPAPSKRADSGEPKRHRAKPKVSPANSPTASALPSDRGNPVGPVFPVDLGNETGGTPSDAAAVASRDSGVGSSDSTEAPSAIEGAGNPPPRYPVLARQRKEQGRLALRVMVDAGGGVTGLSIVASSGSRLLDEAAIDAVKRWRFRPARRNDSAIPGVVEVPILFRLTG